MDLDLDLATIWFVLVAVLWVGYLALEGFDFGVGMLTRRFARDEQERRLLINTIGPVWDGNEVWMIAAVGATFAAFPSWYATAWSSYYLPLAVILVLLILRGLAFEYRGKSQGQQWQRWWDRAIFWGSAVPAFLWGVLLAGFAQGLPLDVRHDFVGDVTDVFTPYTLLGGTVTLLLSLLHGLHYVALKTIGETRGRARALASRIAVPSMLAVAVFVLWTINLRGGGTVTWVAWLTGLAAAGLVGAAGSLNWNRREGWTFVASFVAIVAVGATLFGALYPFVLPSTLEAAGSLTVANASSTGYTLTVMTWVAVPFLPVILSYQSWVYWTFRRRLAVPR